MALDISDTRLNLTITDNDIQAIKHAADRDPIGSKANRIRTIIADWLCGTNRAEAKGPIPRKLRVKRK